MARGKSKMAEEDTIPKKREAARSEVSRSRKAKERLVLYPHTIEEALRAAARTGPPEPISKPERANRQRTKRKEDE
jgi:hypothetical protein